MIQDPVHRSLVAVDIEGYSRRQNLGHLHLRNVLRTILTDAFDGVRIEIDPAEQQDQGDAFLTLVKPDVSKVILVDKFVQEIENGLRRSNRYCAKKEKIRLRVAIHSGEIHPDGTGFGGAAVVAVMRLIDAEQVKKALASKLATKDIAVIISDGIYHDIVMHEYGSIDRQEYGQIKVTVKEFHETAWVRVPGCQAADFALDTPAATPSTRSECSDEQKQGTKPSTEPGGSFNNVHFAGPTSFGGYAAGRDINLNRRGRKHD